MIEELRFAEFRCQNEYPFRPRLPNAFDQCGSSTRRRGIQRGAGRVPEVSFGEVDAGRSCFGNLQRIVERSQAEIISHDPDPEFLEGSGNGNGSRHDSGQEDTNRLLPSR